MNGETRTLGPQDGGAFVVGAITMMFVIVAALLTYQVGMLVDSKIELQNAADSAAYSGATMKAVCVNTVEWISGAMVYVYNNMLTYSFDTMYFAGTTETGTQTDIANYAEAYSQSEDWIERGHGWLVRLGAMQAAIANATPRIVHNEVVDTARRNGADYVAVWPDYEDYEYFLDRSDALNCTFDVTRAETYDSITIAASTDYLLQVRRDYRQSRFFPVRAQRRRLRQCRGEHRRGVLVPHGGGRLGGDHRGGHLVREADTARLRRHDAHHRKDEHLRRGRRGRHREVMQDVDNRQPPAGRGDKRGDRRRAGYACTVSSRASGCGWGISSTGTAGDLPPRCIRSRRASAIPT